MHYCAGSICQRTRQILCMASALEAHDIEEECTGVEVLRLQQQVCKVTCSRSGLLTSSEPCVVGV
jgi:hypothetical protein